MRLCKGNWKAVLAIFMVPLTTPSNWSEFRFMNAQPNKVEHLKEGLKIQVNNSASPLIYAFEKGLPLKKLELKARLQGSLPQMKKGVRQGLGKQDDFILRMGLIYQGEDRLSWFQRQLAPTWLVNMEKKLPADKGIEKVHFYTTCLQDSLLGKIHKHSLHTKLVQECLVHLRQTGPFQMTKELPGTKSIIGLWVSSDGDDMGHQFDLLIEEIRLTY